MIIGFRYFRPYFLRGRWEVGSLINTLAWGAEPMEAMCDPVDYHGILEEPHTSPHAHCECGFYQRWSFNSDGGFSSFKRGSIPGVTLNWGKLVAHGESGFRSQHTQLLGLTLPMAVELNIPVSAYKIRLEMAEAGICDQTFLKPATNFPFTDYYGLRLHYVLEPEDLEELLVTARVPYFRTREGLEAYAKEFGEIVRKLPQNGPLQTKFTPVKQERPW